MASKPESVALSDVTNTLTQQIIIASCTDSWRHRIKLVFTPSTNYFHTYIGEQLDGVFNAFEAQRAIDRYNELIGAN